MNFDHFFLSLTFLNGCARPSSLFFPIFCIKRYLNVHFTNSATVTFICSNICGCVHKTSLLWMKLEHEKSCVHSNPFIFLQIRGGVVLPSPKSQVRAQSQIEKSLSLKSYVLSVFVIVSGPVGNPESSSVHRRSPKSINQNSYSWACPCRLQSGS